MSAAAAFLLLLLSWPLLVTSIHPRDFPPNAAAIAARGNSRNVPPLGFYDPRDQGGSWLTVRACVRARARTHVLPTPLPFFSSVALLASKQHVSPRPRRTHQRRAARHVRPRRTGRSGKRGRLAELLFVRRSIAPSLARGRGASTELTSRASFVCRFVQVGWLCRRMSRTTFRKRSGG